MLLASLTGYRTSTGSLLLSLYLNYPNLFLISATFVAKTGISESLSVTAADENYLFVEGCSDFRIQRLDLRTSFRLITLCNLTISMPLMPTNLATL